MKKTNMDAFIQIPNVQKIKEYALKKKVPIIQDEGLSFLLATIEHNQPRRILEIGTAIGYSAIAMAYFNQDCIIDTVERDASMVEMAIENIHEMGLSNRIRVIDKDALFDIEDELYLEYDLIFIDAAKAQYQKLFDKFQKFLSKNGLIVTDNLNFHGLVYANVEHESKNVRNLVRKLEQYRSYLETHSTFITSFHDVGDGMSISKRIHKPKIMVDLESIDRMDEYDTDTYICNLRNLSTYHGTTFTVEDIVNIQNKAFHLHRGIIVSLDKIIEESELDELNQTLDQLVKLKLDGIIYSDYSVYAYFVKHLIEIPLIYDAKTMMTNSQEAALYQSLNQMVMVSNELSLNQVRTITSQGNVCIEVYGYHSMFYSKRKLLSIFKEFESLGEQVTHRKLYIKEELRPDKYPIVESSIGTIVYTDYIYAAMQEIADFVEEFQWIKVHALFLEHQHLMQVLQIYRQFLNNPHEDIELLSQKLFDLHPLTSDGFLKTKSFLLKEDV